MKARIAVIGCGWWSTYAHLPAIADHPEAEIVALVDPDRERLARAADICPGAETFLDAASLFESSHVDAAIVAVPHALHYPVARLVLSRGVHTLLEKPMVIEPAHGRELIELARSTGAELVIDYPWHYNRQALALRAEIAAGGIGPIEHVSCLYASTVRELYRGNPEPYRDLFGYPVNAPGTNTYSDPALSGGGQGQTQITHSAALLLWLTGLEPESVTAFSANFELEVDLADSAALRFRNGAIGSLTSTGSVLPGFEELVRYEIFGRDGHILFDVNRGTATVHRDGASRALDLLPPAERNPEHAPARNLVDIALGRAHNGSPAEIGLRAVEFVAAMYRAAREERVVKLSEI